MRAGRTSMGSLTGMQGLGGSNPGSYTGNIADVSITRLIRENMEVLVRFTVRPFTYLYAGSQTGTYYASTIGFRYTPHSWPVVLRQP